MEIIYIGKHSFMRSVERHSHEYGEIVYCTEGAGAFADEEGRTVPYQKGDAVLVPPRMVHWNTSGEGFSNFFIAVSNPDKMPPRLVRVPDNGRNDLYHCIEQAHFYFNSDVQGRGVMLQCLTELIRQYLLLFSGTGLLSKYSNLILQDIVGNFSDAGYHPMDYIRTLPFNAEYLSKRFLRETGKTPNQYLAQLRVEHARKMLSQQKTYGLTVREVAESCGFSDALYFSRVFKAATGAAPSAYARSLQAGGPGRPED